jgi:phosphate acetyltransferase
MANSLYVSAAEPYSGKVLVSLGLMNLLERNISHVGFFRPVANPYRLVGREEVVADRDAYLMHGVHFLDFDLEEMYGVTSQEADEALAAGRECELHERILEKYKRLEQKVDFILCEGTDFLSVTSSVETDFNAAIARNLNTPVLLVVDGSSNDPDTIYSKARIGLDAFQAKGCQILAAIINKVDRDSIHQLEGKVSSRLRKLGVGVTAKIPKEPSLSMPRMDEVAASLGGKVLFGRKHLQKKVGKIVVAAGAVETVLPYLDNNVLLVTHIDRHDIIMMAFLSLASHSAPNIAGMILTGERELAEPVMNLLRGLPDARIPIVRVTRDTFETICLVERVKASLEPTNVREIDIARQLFESHVDTDALSAAIRVSAPQQMTPSLFKYELIRRARQSRKRIVLPEGLDERILRAADALIRLEAVDLTILGPIDAIRSRAVQLGVDLHDTELIDPQTSELTEAFADIYRRARQHKGMTQHYALEHVLEAPVFGTMMVHTGHADGMVAGATTSTAATIRPAFQIIKTKRGCKQVSSVFFMCLEDRVLVYGDCAVQPDPTAPELAEIALQSAETAAAFGIEPIVAMLSYSTGESGKGADVDKVKEAVRLAREARPELVLEGPMQYDAAVDPVVAAKKAPDSRVGGRATVLIFPDLNTGNNTYKAVQRSAGAIAIGPVLQGLNAPVNDLSRGCLVEDIITTVAITAIQAQDPTDRPSGMW